MKYWFPNYIFLVLFLCLCSCVSTNGDKGPYGNESLLRVLREKEVPYPSDNVYENDYLQDQFDDGFKMAWDMFLEDGSFAAEGFYTKPDDKSIEAFDAWKNGVAVGTLHAIEIQQQYKRNPRLFLERYR